MGKIHVRIENSDGQLQHNTYNSEGNLAERVNYLDDRTGKALRQITLKDGTPVLASGKKTDDNLALMFAMGGRLEGPVAKDSDLKPGEYYLDAYDRIAEFILQPDHRTALVKKIRELKLFDLKKSYSDDDVQDGTPWEFKIAMDGRSHQVFCSNKFPDELKELRNFLRQDILPAYDLEILASKTVHGSKESRNFDLPK